MNPRWSAPNNYKINVCGRNLCQLQKLGVWVVISRGVQSNSVLNQLAKFGRCGWKLVDLMSVTIDDKSSNPNFNISGLDDGFEHKKLIFNWFNRIYTGKVVVFHRGVCSASCFSPISQNLALSLWDPPRACWDSTRSCRDSAWSPRDPPRSSWDPARSRRDSA